MVNKPTKSYNGLPADWGKLSIRIPPATLKNLKALVNADRSVSSICRGLVESACRKSRKLGSLEPPNPWALVSVYLENATKEQIAQKVRLADGKRTSVAKAVAWLVEQKYGRKA